MTLAKRKITAPIVVMVVLAAGCDVQIGLDPSQEPAAEPFSVVEATIPEMQQAMQEGRVSSRELVQQYLTRIALYENTLNPTITVNPRALEIAESLDAERAAGHIRGPLHGIPIALKDNINTADLPTTGGALAFEGLIPPYDATVTENLRAAGAVIIAKTVMTELANWVAGDPNFMPGNYSRLPSSNSSTTMTRTPPSRRFLATVTIVRSTSSVRS